MRVIGMDIHRVFAEVVALVDGKATRLGRVDMRRDRLEAFARSTLTHDDHVVVEATGNAAAVVEVLGPHVGRVVIANPKQVRLIADAKVKTDKIDATVLAQLYASGFLPEVWIPDERTAAMRRQVTRRTQLVRQRTRLKNVVQSILHAHLIPPCPHQDPFGRAGREWLAGQWLPGDEREAVARHIRELDRLGEELRGVERDIARRALDDAVVRRLMTVPGIDMVVATGLAAAIGDVDRFASPGRLVALPRAEPERTAIRRRSGPPRPDQQAGPRAGPRHAGRGRLVGGALARSAARLLPAHRSPPGPAHRGRRHRAEDRGRGLAHAEAGRGLHLGQAGAARKEAARPRAQGRASAPAGPARQRPGLQPPRHPRGGEAARRRGRGRVPAPHRRLATEGAEAGAHGRRKGGTTIGAARRGLPLRAPLFATRSPMRRGKIASNAEKGCSTSSVVCGV